MNFVLAAASTTYVPDQTRQALTQPHPLNATLAMIKNAALANNIDPPNVHSASNPLLSKIAPPIGVPISKPIETNAKLCPNLVPIFSLASPLNCTMTVGGRLTKEPEKKP